MLVVVTIIALFAALVLPKMMDSGRQGAQDAAPRRRSTAYMTALGTYKLDTGVYPTTEQGLQALRVKPEDVNNWRSVSAEGHRHDPWTIPTSTSTPAITATSRTSSATAATASPEAKG